MIGTELVERLVQSVALSHLVKGHQRVSLLMLAAPESGKTTIATAAHCKHVQPVAVISGRSILREMRDHKETEFILFNDLTAIRAMSNPAVNLLITMLNQLTQGERGRVAFAGMDPEDITRTLGIIACLPFDTFTDHRARWKELGFISRMIPFAYSYGNELIAEIKDSIDNGQHASRRMPSRTMPRIARPLSVAMNRPLTEELRRIADARAVTLKQLGIRLLVNYHSVVRAHALLHKRRTVTKDDLTFIRAVDRYVSITECRSLNGAH